MTGAGTGIGDARRRNALATAMAAGLVLASGPAFAQSTASSEAMEEATPLMLEGILVEGDQGAVTEGTGDYATDRATVGSKQPADLRDIPQAVTVLTREMLDDGQAGSIEEAAYLIPTVTTATGDLFSGSLYVRGHEVFTYNVDGAPRPLLSIYGTAPDLYFFDRLEILSGPSGLFQGSGEPVGTLNLVRKRPLDYLAYGGGAYADTFGGYRGEADVSAPITEDGRLRARLMAFGEHDESFVDITERDHEGVYGTVEYDLTAATTIAVGSIAEWIDQIRFSGLPAFTDGTLIDLDSSTFVGAPWNNFDTTNVEGFAEIEHEFDYGGVLKAQGRIYSRDTDLGYALGITGVDPATGNFSLFGFAREYNETTSYLDVNFTSPLTIMGREGETAVGVDYRYSRTVMKQNFAMGLSTQNIYSFDPYAVPEPDFTFPGVGPGFRLNTETITQEFGAYAQGRLEVVDGLDITLGGRVPYYESDARDTGRNTDVSDINETRFVPYAGISYDLLPALTVYTSYSEIFQPQEEQQADGAQLQPIVGQQIELGTKAELFDGVNAQAAVFWLQDQHRAQEDPLVPGAFTASGEAITRGFEVSAVGRVVPGFDISVGYAYVDTELETDPTPKNNVTLWGKYSLLDGPLDGLYLGAGMRAASAAKNLAGTVTIEAPGYAIFNALVGYEITENVDAQVYVENLFDRKYYERVNEVARGNFYGAPLNATFRVTAAF